MSDDKATIPDELRIAASWEHSQLGTLCEKAADEIDRLTAQVAMLREALHVGRALIMGYINGALTEKSKDEAIADLQIINAALNATAADVEAWEKSKRNAVLEEAAILVVNERLEYSPAGCVAQCIRNMKDKQP